MKRNEHQRKNAGGGGSGGGVVVRSTAPSDTKVLWIDTAMGGVAKYYDGTGWVAIHAVWG